MQLSKNFSLWEFTISQTAERYGLNNQPNAQQIANLKLLCETILQPARDAIGPLKISSGYRSPALNRKVGGSPSSAHSHGWAADVLPVECSKMEFAKWIASNCKFDQIILEFGSRDNPAWIHVSADPRARRESLRILQGTGYQACKL